MSDGVMRSMCYKVMVLLEAGATVREACREVGLRPKAFKAHTVKYYPGMVQRIAELRAQRARRQATAWRSTPEGRALVNAAARARYWREEGPRKPCAVCGAQMPAQLRSKVCSVRCKAAARRAYVEAYRQRPEVQARNREGARARYAAGHPGCKPRPGVWVPAVVPVVGL